MGSSTHRGTGSESLVGCSERDVSELGKRGDKICLADSALARTKTGRGKMEEAYPGHVMRG